MFHSAANAVSMSSMCVANASTRSESQASDMTVRPSLFQESLNGSIDTPICALINHKPFTLSLISRGFGVLGFWGFGDGDGDWRWEVGDGRW